MTHTTTESTETGAPAQKHREFPDGPCKQCAFPGDEPADPRSESPALASAAATFASWLTWAQAAALIAIAIAAICGIGQAIWEMISARNISLGDLLMLFLYIEILSMVKGASLGTREIPIHTPIALAIVAVARYIVVDVEHINAITMLCTSVSILLLVVALWLIRRTGKSMKGIRAS
ncbi:phosphate-starvation-inducible protein PsiE [Sutterella sp.]|uniref:phosphate-starvation-inducible protein PsiE n=1 Tax=Sutterella sp. TaxID=1981025 RepID=UPI0026DF1AAC|nr:phosphate-starvation-inducible PsiE family protein [Sutterella sp.]MDO5532108.1 phosphate-starvation-inducible PsiE family protein [Sutterella sp.]